MQKEIDNIFIKLVAQVRQTLIVVQIGIIGLVLATNTSARAEQVFTFGVVPQFEARALAMVWMPILAELEQRTGLKFKMIGSPRIPEFEEGYERGEFDFAYMNPYHILVANDKQGYIPLVRDGGRQLFGVLVVRKYSPIQSVTELDGQVISFPAPNALGSSLLMRADLDKIHNISIEPVYVSTHTSSYLNVVLGRAAAAGGVMSTFNMQIDEIKDALRILYQTRRMPPHPIVAHPRVPADIREKVQRAILEMAETIEGAEMLAKVPIRKAIPAELAEYMVLGEWGLENYFVLSSE